MSGGVEGKAAPTPTHGRELPHWHQTMPLATPTHQTAYPDTSGNNRFQ